MTQSFRSHPGDVPHLAIVLKRQLSTIQENYSTLDSPIFTGDPQAPTPPTSDNDTSIATTAFVKNQNYAPLASPSFTGDPKAPTPAPADNDTSIATTAFVHAAVVTAGGITQLTGDAAAGPGSGSQAVTLAAVNGNVGTFQGLTVNAKGLVTAAANQSYGVGTLTGVTAGTGLNGGGTSGNPTLSLTAPVSVANGGTGDTGTAWSAYTPTVGATSGTITAASAAGRYKTIGKTVHLAFEITITTNGSGAGGVTATLPAAPNTAIAAILAGRENQNTGKMLQASMAGGGLQIYNYDNTYPGGNGNILLVSGVYEAA